MVSTQAKLTLYSAEMVRTERADAEWRDEIAAVEAQVASLRDRGEAMDGPLLEAFGQALTALSDQQAAARPQSLNGEEQSASRVIKGVPKRGSRSSRDSRNLA